MKQTERIEWSLMTDESSTAFLGNFIYFLIFFSIKCVLDFLIFMEKYVL
jgi:hypothetical protein